MPSFALQAPQDPALSARTFSQNPTLTAALNRIRAQHKPSPVPVISGIETDGSDATDDPSRPTDQELNEHFLLIKGWKRSDIWIDPLTGLTYLMADALSIQNRREDELNG